MPEDIVNKISGKKHICAIYEVRGERIELWFNPDSPWSPITATYNEKLFAAKDIEAMLDQLKRATRRKRVAINIPITHENGRDAIITGKHAGNNNILVTWEDNGQSEQLDRYDYRHFFRRLTPEQKRELKQLKAASDEANRQLNNFHNDLKIDLDRAAEDAIGEIVELAIAEEETPEEEETV